MLSANPKIRGMGFTLIELLIGVAIMAILAGLAMPAFRSMVLNTQTRTAAETIQSGLQRARSEAIKHNSNVEFVFVGAAGDSSWEVRLVSAPVPPLARGFSSEASKSVQWAVTGGTSVTFNSLGTVGIPGKLPLNNDNSPPFSQVDLATIGGDKNLRILIGTGGDTKMCDPGLPASNPRGCP